MRLSIRLAALVLAGGALVGAAWAQPALIEGLGRAFGGDAERQEESARKRGNEVGRREGVIVRRIEAKDAVVGSLLEGRLTLREAVQRFKDLNEKPADCQDDYRARYSGCTDDEKLRRQVLDWVRVALDRLPPSQAAAIHARLDAELNDGLRFPIGAATTPGA